MMPTLRKIALTLLLLLSFCYLNAQTAADFRRQKDTLNNRSIITGSLYNIDEDNAYTLINQSPYFGLFHDNYFVGGVPLNKEITKNSANAKFQISIQQRFIKGILPYNMFLSGTYTQKSFWSIFKESKPFSDNNFNPGVSLSSFLIRDSKLKGFAVFSIEHESNGRDSTQSRSWNYAALSYNHFFNIWFSGQIKLWRGWINEKNNSNLMKYKGYGLLALNYQSKSDRLWVSLILNPTNKFNNVNTTVEINFKTGPNVNQYLFLQYFSGYGENMLDYTHYGAMLRLGVCIKPAIKNFY